jgi:hypothetical protein
VNTPEKSRTGAWGAGRRRRPEAPNVKNGAWGAGRRRRPEAPNVQTGDWGKDGYRDAHEPIATDEVIVLSDPRNPKVNPVWLE